MSPSKQPVYPDKKVAEAKREKTPERDVGCKNGKMPSTTEYDGRSGADVATESDDGSIEGLKDKAAGQVPGGGGGGRPSLASFLAGGAGKDCGGGEDEKRKESAAECDPGKQVDVGGSSTESDSASPPKKESPPPPPVPAAPPIVPLLVKTLGELGQAGGGWLPGQAIAMPMLGAGTGDNLGCDPDTCAQVKCPRTHALSCRNTEFAVLTRWDCVFVCRQQSQPSPSFSLDTGTTRRSGGTWPFFVWAQISGESWRDFDLGPWFFAKFQRGLDCGRQFNF